MAPPSPGDGTAAPQLVEDSGTPAYVPQPIPVGDPIPQPTIPAPDPAPLVPPKTFLENFNTGGNVEILSRLDIIIEELQKLNKLLSHEVEDSEGEHSTVPGSDPEG